MTVLVTLKFPVKPLVLENFLIVLKEALKEYIAMNNPIPSRKIKGSNSENFKEIKY